MKKIITLLSVLAMGTLFAFGQSQDTYGTTTLTALVNPMRYATTFTSSGVNIGGYIGQPAVILCSTNIDGTNPTMTAKLQLSQDNTNFADLASGSFSAVTTNSTQTLALDTTSLGNSNYVRCVLTIGGTTPTNVTSIVLIGRKKYN